MKIPVLLATMLAMTALAGCSGGAAEDGGSNGDGTSATQGVTNTAGAGNNGGGNNNGGGGNEGGDGGNGATQNPDGGNTAPSGSLAATVKEGTVPLAVNFTLDGADADGDELSWTLDMDGDGTADEESEAGATFPAETSHVYDTAGTFVVTYIVSDGLLEVSFSLNITALPGAPVEPLNTDRIYGTLEGTTTSGPPAAAPTYGMKLTDPGASSGPMATTTPGYGFYTFLTYTADREIAASGGLMQLQVSMSCTAPAPFVGIGWGVFLDDEAVVTGQTGPGACTTSPVTMMQDVPLEKIPNGSVVKIRLLPFMANGPDTGSIMKLNFGGTTGTALLL